MKTEQSDTSSYASLIATSKPADFQYERSDWTLFRSVNTLPQKAGVSAEKLRRLVLKELADNALDAGGGVRVHQEDMEGNSFSVQDDGPGIDPDRVGLLFSINRPLISSKLWRLPTRGAMGNGLRVVTGSIIASGGSLTVYTRNKRLDLHPQEDGSTAVAMQDADFPVGTRVEITFGDALPEDPQTTYWAKTAARLKGGEAYSGKSSPFWYDGDAFYELLQATGGLPVRSLVADLDGCSGAKAGKIAADFKGRPCQSMSRDEAINLLLAARAEARPVRAERLPVLRDADMLPLAYDCQRGEFQYGAREPFAQVPFAAEAWVASQAGNDERIEIFINRTPITGSVYVSRDGAKLEIYGCGLHHEFSLPKADIYIAVNVTTPYCPYTSDGKDPDLSPFVHCIAGAIKKAGRRARQLHTKNQTTERITAKSVVLSSLDEAVRKASGDGLYRFNQRQLFYVVRPFVMEATGSELTYGNFEGIIADYENLNGDVPGMYRDPRGSLYHPHEGTTIPLGTLAVEDYQRPTWTFNKVLYIEKEGPFEALKSARWPERHDCALVTSKGFASRAVKDLLDLLGDDGEPLTVFCIHDADAAGTMIYQTLQSETRARGRRTIEIINLGLDPWEAIRMGLEEEGVELKNRNQAVADYVLNRPDADRWRQWLKAKRIELNAMTTPDFIAWLDRKMAKHVGEKIIPPASVLADEMQDRVEGHLRQMITDRILEEAGIDDMVDEAIQHMPEPDGSQLAEELFGWLPEHEDQAWRTYINAVARTASRELADR